MLQVSKTAVRAILSLYSNVSDADCLAGANAKVDTLMLKGPKEVCFCCRPFVSCA